LLRDVAAELRLHEFSHHIEPSPADVPRRVRQAPRQNVGRNIVPADVTEGEPGRGFVRHGERNLGDVREVSRRERHSGHTLDGFF